MPKYNVNIDVSNIPEPSEGLNDFERSSVTRVVEANNEIEAIKKVVNKEFEE